MQINDEYGRIKGAKLDQGQGNCINDRWPNRVNTLGRIYQIFSWNFDIKCTVSQLDAAESFYQKHPLHTLTALFFFKKISIGRMLEELWIQYNSQLRILHWTEEENVSSIDSRTACLCHSIEIKIKHVYRQSQVWKPTDSEVRRADCSLKIGTGCSVQVF